VIVEAPLAADLAALTEWLDGQGDPRSARVVHQ
jgi:hypothetical protein